VNDDIVSDDDDLELADFVQGSDSTNAAMEFALELYLEEFIVTNWDPIDWGRRLEIWDDGAGQSGHQLNTPVGRLDLLARDLDSDELVVIELKRGKTQIKWLGRPPGTSDGFANISWRRVKQFPESSSPAKLMID